MTRQNNNKQTNKQTPWTRTQVCRYRGGLLNHKAKEAVQGMLLLLLHSQLYLWGSPFSMRFLRMWPFFNPTIQVVTFRLRGRCMLGVFLLPAFPRLGRECQDLWSSYDGMHVCTDKTSVYTVIRKSFGGNGTRNPVNSKGKISSTGLFVGCSTSQQQASVSQGRICSDNCTCCHTEIHVADRTFFLTQSQYTDTGPTSPSADPISPGAWQGCHWSANF